MPKKMGRRLQDLAQRAVEVLAELEALDTDTSRWRLAPGPFLALACKEGGIDPSAVPGKLEKLRGPGFERACRAVEFLAGEFLRKPQAHHAAGQHRGRFDAEGVAELSALGLTVRMASALAAYIATSGGTISEEEWGGRSEYPEQILELRSALEQELEELNALGSSSITLADLSVTYAGDRGDASLCRVTVRGTSTPAWPLEDLVTRLALQLVEQRSLVEAA